MSTIKNKSVDIQKSPCDKSNFTVALSPDDATLTKSDLCIMGFSKETLNIHTCTNVYGKIYMYHLYT